VAPPVSQGSKPKARLANDSRTPPKALGYRVQLENLQPAQSSMREKIFDPGELAASVKPSISPFSRLASFAPPMRWTAPNWACGRKLQNWLQLSNFLLAGLDMVNERAWQSVRPVSNSAVFQIPDGHDPTGIAISAESDDKSAKWIFFLARIPIESMSES